MVNLINHIRVIYDYFNQIYLNNEQQDEDIDLDPHIKRIFKTMFKLILFLLYLIYWFPTRIAFIIILLLEWIIITFIISPILFVWFWCMTIQDPRIKADLRRKIAGIVETFSYVMVSLSILSFVAFLFYPYIIHAPAAGSKLNHAQGITKNWTAIFSEYQKAWIKTQMDKEIIDTQLRQLHSQIDQHQTENSAEHIKIWNELQRKQDQIDLIKEALIQEVRNAINEGEMDDEDAITLENLSKMAFDSLQTHKTEEMIQTALNIYHQDVLNRADYALIHRNARIVPRLTSLTYDKFPVWKQAIYGFFNNLPLVNAPIEAISPSTNVGECWTMYGSNGTLGIKLSEPIFVQSITIDYPSSDIMVGDMSKAPRKIELYGITHTEGTRHNMYLGSAEYDIYSDYTVQTFDMNSSQRDYFSIVQIHFLSNWGNPNCTEVYRVRIHGTPLSIKKFL